MAGRIKHMERSHRSHRKNYGVFNSFHSKAYSRAYARQQKLTLGQMFAKYLAPVKNTLKRVVSE